MFPMIGDPESPSYFQTAQRYTQNLDYAKNEAKKFAQAIRSIFYFLVWSVSLTVEVFLRRRIGERYLAIGPVLGGLLSIFILAAPGPGVVNPTAAFQDIFIYAMIYIALVIVHRVAIMHRNRQGVRWHSRSSGLPWPTWRHLTKHVFRIHIIYEPLFCFVAGFLIASIFQRPLGGYFMFAGVMLFIKSAMEYSAARTQLLDAIDSQIESEHMAEALAGSKTPEETDGFIVPGANMWAPNEKESIARALDRSPIIPQPAIQPVSALD
jgi:hypothetical protein